MWKVYDRRKGEAEGKPFSWQGENKAENFVSDRVSPEAPIRTSVLIKPAPQHQSTPGRFSEPTWWWRVGEAAASCSVPPRPLNPLHGWSRQVSVTVPTPSGVCHRPHSVNTDRSRRGPCSLRPVPCAQSMSSNWRARETGSYVLEFSHISLSAGKGNPRVVGTA